MVNLRTQVTYKNRDLKTISKCEYALKDYTDMLSLDLKRIITDIEDLLYMATGGKSKADWQELELLAFEKIKHKILDKAGEIGRLPENIFDADQCENSASSFWDRLFNSKEGE
jgi:hypothetical protein